MLNCRRLHAIWLAVLCARASPSRRTRLPAYNPGGLPGNIAHNWPCTQDLYARKREITTEGQFLCVFLILRTLRKGSLGYFFAATLLAGQDEALGDEGTAKSRKGKLTGEFQAKPGPASAAYVVAISGASSSAVRVSNIFGCSPFFPLRNCSGLFLLVLQAPYSC